MNKLKSKTIEVEIRARLDDVDGFKRALVGCKAKYNEKIYLHDIYFCNREAKSIEDVEMNVVGSYSLRLRKQKKERHKEKLTVNTKTIISHGDHNAWEEHETEISDFFEAAEILNTTEFKPFFELEKTRYIYLLDGMEICVEEIKDFGGAVEVEIMCESGEEVEAKKRIKAFLSKCNVEKDLIVPKSITNIIMKERAFKKAISF